MIESGTIVETGTYEELRSKKEIFSEFTKTFIDNKLESEEEEQQHKHIKKTYSK